MKSLPHEVNKEANTMEGHMSPQTPLHKTLHQATRSAHRRLECRIENYHPKFDVDHYRHLLQDYLGFYQPLERKLVVLADHLLPSPYQHRWLKTPRLEQDLLSLGMTQADIAALPLCGRLPAVPTHPQAVGVLYVIQDAIETGRLADLSQCERLGIQPSPGGSFFSSAGPPLEQYRQSDTLLTTATGGPSFQTLAIEAALDTFACFEAWLDYRRRSRHMNSSRWTVGSKPELAGAFEFDSLSGAA
jgi:heme oxygenase